LGQKIKSFNVEAFVDGKWQWITSGSTVGYKRILRFPTVTTTKVRLNITDSKKNILISNVGIYNAPVLLDAPTISRNKAGDITISGNDIGPYFYYTLDGSTPTDTSNRYTGPINKDGKVEVKAIAYDFANHKASSVSTEKFDVSKKNWKVIGVTDQNVDAVFDGSTTSAWHQKDTKMPADFVIDLGSMQPITGFKYFPDTGIWGPGIITQYEFYVSTDNKTWKLVNKGEFPNIKNNPVWQIKTFTREDARYLKLRSISLVNQYDTTGYAEIDVITE
jgi:alpha-L-fucosidase